MATRYCVIPKCLVHYRQHESNSSRSKEKTFAVCNEYEEIIRFTEEKNKLEEVSAIICDMLMRTYKWNYYRLKNSPNQKKFLCRWSEDLKRYAAKNIVLDNKENLKKKFDYYIIKYFPVIYSLIHASN